MVTILKAHVRQTKTGSSFVSLELQGDVTLIQSAKTGKFYATAQRCYISSTFTEEVAKSLIGTRLAGNIQKVDADPYDYTIPETGEVVELSHRYEYVPESGPTSAPVPYAMEIV